MLSYKEFYPVVKYRVHTGLHISCTYVQSRIYIVLCKKGISMKTILSGISQQSHDQEKNLTVMLLKSRNPRIMVVK